MILASGSPRRLQLLRDMSLSPVVMPADIDETPREGESPTELVRRLASEKAVACQERLSPELADEVIVAADTTVWFQGVELGKPLDAQDAQRMLLSLSGRTHHVSTGVTVRRDERVTSFVETSDVTFYDLSEGEVAAYVLSGEPMDKAGAYGIQGLGRLLVREIRGDYFNIVGLPVARLARELGAFLDGDGTRAPSLTATILGGGNGIDF